MQSLFSPGIIVWFTQYQVLPSNGVRPQGRATLIPNAPEHLMQSASHGHSAPKHSVLTSPSTSQGHSSDQFQAQVASKNVHPPACRSAQGFSNTKPANSSERSMQSASHGYSASKLSVLTSSSTSQCHSSDQSQAQVASKNIHPPACRSAQGFSNTKPANSSQKKHNQQAKFSASESASSLPHRDRRHPYSSKQETIRKGMQ